MAQPFNIILASGLAVTAPDGGEAGRLSLAPLNDSNPRQKFVVNKGMYLSPAQNIKNVLEIQLPQGKNEPEEGDAVEIKKRDGNNTDNQTFTIKDGVVSSMSYDEFTLGFGGVALVRKDSPLGQASTKAASVTIQNGTGGPVYISYESVADGATQTIQVPKGKTLRAIDSNGQILAPTPAQITGDQKIVLTKNLSLTVTNDAPFKIQLKPTVSPGPSSVTIEPKAQNVVITAPFGTIYKAYAPDGSALMFIDDVKGNPLDFVLVDEAIEIYHVVVPCINTFLNNTPSTAFLSTKSQFFPPIEIRPKGQYLSTVSPGTVYQAKDSLGNSLTITSINDPKNSGANVTVNESDDFFRITVTPPVPTYPIVLQNTSTQQITVTVQGSNQPPYKINANSSSDSITLPEGSILTAVAADGKTPVAPERKRVDKSETVTYTAGLLLPDAQKNAIQSWLPGKTFAIAYKASRDGFGAVKFHYFCDGVGPTLVIITTPDGHRFGGFAPDNWGVAGYGRDKATFIFTLSNPWGTAPTKFAGLDNSNNNIGIMPDSMYGAAFGAGNDIYVSPYPNTDDKSYTLFPTSFGPDPTGRKETFFTGKKFFRASEIEVYKVQ